MRTTHGTVSRIALVLALAASLTACGPDDGGEVREVGNGTASGSGTGSGTGTGTGSGTGTGTGTEASGTATGAAVCEEAGISTDPDVEVSVALTEWSVTPEPRAASGSVVEFEAVNNGTEPHELVVVRTPSISALPKADDGSVDEEALGERDFIGEIEPFPAGEECHGTFRLAPGDYALFCNIVEQEDGEEVNHFTEGMRTMFRVGG